MNFYQRIARPLLFSCDPEKCHDVAIFAMEMSGRIPLACSMLGIGHRISDPRLETDVCGLHFKNPVGLAAGFDKSGRAVEGLAALGFGHIEIGSVSADPSQGNPKPRLFRLINDRAILVHYGLPNDGAETIAKRLSTKRVSVPIGINIVKTNRGMDAPPESDEEIIEDYLRSARQLKNSGAYLALNLSCPNTSHGRDFFSVQGNTRRLLTELEKLNIQIPVFLKVSAAGGLQKIDALLDEVNGVTVVSGFEFNLTPEKPQNLMTPRQLWENRKGAISGKPIEVMMNEAICNLYSRIDHKRYQIIGAGGIFCAEDAYLKIRLGASLVQILTALIYEGPGVVAAINQGLSQLLARDGFRSVSEAVGTLKHI